MQPRDHFSQSRPMWNEPVEPVDTEPSNASCVGWNISQIIYDVQMQLINIVTRWPGPTHNSLILTSSMVGNRLQAGTVQDDWFIALPSPTCCRTLHHHSQGSPAVELNISGCLPKKNSCALLFLTAVMQENTEESLNTVKSSVSLVETKRVALLVPPPGSPAKRVTPQREHLPLEDW